MPSDRPRRPLSRNRLGRASSVACSALILLVALSTSAVGSTPDTVATASGGALSPPPDSPFSEAVGGAALAATGVPVVSTATPPLPAVEAPAWLVADLDSGSVLAALDAHAPLPPASTIKLLTALAVLPSVDAGQPYTATEEDARTEGSRVGLVPDHQYTIADLEHALLLASGNDAATALAAIVGGQDRALALMNDEAARLGAFDTNATNPHGLDAPGQVTSAYDLALIARAVLADEHLAGLVRTRTYDFPGLDGATFQIQNHNRLLGDYDGAIGLKTGYTSVSGHSLVAAAQRDGTRLVTVVLGAESRAEPAAQALLDWGFGVRELAEPVGTLVTPEQVAAAVADSAESPDPDAPPSGTAADALNPGQQPSWVWVAAAAAGAAAIVLGLSRRRRRRRTGRYTGRV
ncbi:MAG TPA: D-alanyl-D-alanine carboxypeptidase family protein [Jiangellaceae bacterium]|nr:D-alanyl-D-alanine carboxypeptidase family protein [Jiangellaceae bacterium]